MSAGAFTTTRYATNAGEIHPIRLQPETLALTIDGTANAAPTGALTRRLRATVSRSNGANGLKPRSVTIRFTGAPPVGYKPDQTFTLPVLQAALWDSAIEGVAAEYLGVAAQVVSTGAESLR